MKCVAILGMGLMGGSLALALRRRAPSVRLRAYARRAQTREAVRVERLADSVYERPEQAVAGADLIVICVPVERIPALVEACRAGLEAGAVVTDVGSTKAWVQSESARALKGTSACFVGSHPIAGSERQGLEAARADLYEGAVTVVTDVGADNAAADRVDQLWRKVGSRVLRMSAGQHDRILARTSHLPHLAAAALAATAGRGAETESQRDFCGTGLRDATRIADGGPELWTAIVRTNRDAILKELAAFSRIVERLTQSIRAGADEDVFRLLQEGRRARRRLLGEATAPPHDGA